MSCFTPGQGISTVGTVPLFSLALLLRLQLVRGYFVKCLPACHCLALCSSAIPSHLNIIRCAIVCLPCHQQWLVTATATEPCCCCCPPTGDILGIATGSSRVYTCGADGSIRSWLISKTGELTESVQREKAHSDRVTALLWHKNIVYSVSYDGSIKAWDAETLELMMEVRGAHEGTRIYCAAVGPDGVLYTGGDDKLVRR